MISEVLGAIAGSSGLASGDSSPVPEAGASEEASATSASRARTRQEAEEIPGSEEDSGSGVKTVGDEDKASPPPEEYESESEGTSGETESEDESQSGEFDGAGASEQSPFGNYAGGGASGNAPSQGASEEEIGCIPLEQTDRCSNPLDGSLARNEDYEHLKNEKAASDIERILDKMAERAACAELESERLTELNEAAQSISYGDIHSGVQIRVNRIASVDETLVEQYDEISAPLLTISRQLQKSIVRQLKDSRRGGKQTGLLMGRRLDSHASA